MQKLKTTQRNFDLFLSKTLMRLDDDVIDRFYDDLHSICIDLSSTLSNFSPDLIRNCVRQYFTKLYPVGTSFDVHVNLVDTRDSMFLSPMKSKQTQVFITINSNEGIQKIIMNKKLYDRSEK